VAHGNVGALLKKHGYTEIKKVGEGSFGKAILVEGADRARLICKMVDVSKASSKERQDAIKESQLLAALKHPYIVRYREAFNESGWMCIVMDYCEGGELTKHIETAKRSRKPIAENQILKWFTQAVMALKYIHEKHILHRDLKPQNFFLSGSGSVKMGDFGIAKVLACTMAAAKTQIGTPYYLSPELCQEKPYTWPSDIWAMGCILYEMCAMKVPFDAPNISGLVQKITRGPIPELPGGYSAGLRQLCKQMLTRDPNKRPSADEILERPEVQAMVKSMLAEAGATAQEDLNAPPDEAPLEGPYKESAGSFKVGDLVEYHSTAHKDWLPAKVVNVSDGDGRIIIDLKPNTWLSKAEQATRIRPRADPEAAARAQAPPMRQQSPSVVARGRDGGTPMGQRSPSVDIASRPGSRGPGCGTPMRQRSPSVGALPPVGSAMQGGTPRSSAGTYRTGDLVEYYSTSHKDWLPATVNNADAEGRIIIDLKPTTWISREDQATRVRPRQRAVAAGRRPSSRGASPSYDRPWRSPSVGAIDRRGASPGRAMTPMRAPSPGGGGGGPASRCASPRRGAAGVGAGPYPGPGVGAAKDSPNRRPPGLPPARAAQSPLRVGGREIASGGWSGSAPPGASD